MRIRTIKPEFWSHPVMSRQADSAKLLAIGLLNLADDEGYFYADPKMVRNALRPMDDDSGITTVSLRELSEIGFISIKTHPTHGQIGFIESFLKHQVINKPKRSIIKGLFNSGSDTVSIPDKDSLERKGKEQGTGKGKELSPEGIEFSEWFKSTLPEQDQKTMETNWLSSFCDAYDKLTRIDGYPPTEIRAVCKWAREDHFWSQNFKSPWRLRKRDSNKTLYWNVFSQRMKQSSQPAQKQLAIHQDPEHASILEKFLNDQ